MMARITNFLSFWGNPEDHSPLMEGISANGHGRLLTGMNIDYDSQDHGTT